MAIAIKKCLADTKSVSLSFIPTPSPIPKIGDINGEISMAPMITAGELRSKPSEAIIMEHINNQALAPRIRLLFLIAIIVPSRSEPSLISIKSWNHSLVEAQSSFKISPVDRFCFIGFVGFSICLKCFNLGGHFTSI